MPSVLQKLIKTFTELFTAATLVIVLIRTAANKDALWDFFSYTFKFARLFIVFVLLFALFLVLLGLKYRQKIPEIGMPPPEEIIKKNKKAAIYNSILKWTRIGSGGLAAIFFVILFFMEIKTDDYGILGGTFYGASGKNELFNGRLNRVTKKNKPHQYSFMPIDKDYYEKGDNELDNIFKRYFENGVIYTGKYDNSSSNNIINLVVRWVGKNKECPILSQFEGAFSNCTVDVNADADLVSNFILGFLYMHQCEPDSADVFFSMVEKSIDTIGSVNIRMRLRPLQDTLVKYRSNLRKLDVANNVDPASMKITPDVAPDSAQDGSDSVAFVSNNSLKDSAENLSEPVVPIQDDILIDNYSTIPFDSVRKYFRGVNVSGSIMMGSWKGNYSLIDIFPFYVYTTVSQVYNNANSLYRRVESDTILHKRHPIDVYYRYYDPWSDGSKYEPLPMPYKSIQVEEYLKHAVSNSGIFRFSRPAQNFYYSKTMSNPFPGRRSGVRCALRTSIPADSIKYFLISMHESDMKNQQPFVNLAWNDGLVAREFPFHIALSRDTVAFVYKNNATGKTYEIIGPNRKNVIYYAYEREIYSPITSIEAYLRQRFKQYSYYVIYAPPQFRFDE